MDKIICEVLKMRTQRRKIFLSILVTILIMSTLLLFVGCKGKPLGKQDPLVGEWTSTDPSHHSPDMESSLVIEQKKGELYFTKNLHFSQTTINTTPIKYDKETNKYAFSLLEIEFIDKDTIRFGAAIYYRIKRK